MEKLHTELISATDGTQLAVRQVGPPGADVTVIFSHGFCLTMDAWLPQCHHLSAALGDTARLVFYDQRGHGQSHTPADPGSYTLAQLGHDLNSVISTVAGGQRVVLVGHSMGGMAIMNFAAHHPESLPAIAGVGLISTAAGQLASCGIGRALSTPAVPLLHYAARHAPWITSHTWSALRRAVAPALGIPVTTSPVVRANQVCCRMISDTPILTVAALLAEFRNHNQTGAIAKLAHLPALVACGEADPITPLQRSLDLAAQLPNAELVRVPHAGHMLELERPHLISAAIERLVTRARGSVPQLATA